MQVGGLLPAHAVDLVSTGELAADGVQFCLAAPAAAASGRCQAPAQTALGWLSGGERTLVSIALLLAVSPAACPWPYSLCSGSALLRQQAQGCCLCELSGHDVAVREAHSIAHQCMTCNNLVLYAGRICRSRQPLTDPGRGARISRYLDSCITGNACHAQRMDATLGGHTGDAALAPLSLTQVTFAR